MSEILSNIHYNVGFALSKHAEAMARLQEQAATGSRINRVSDAPSEAYRLLGLNSQLRNLGNYINGLSEVIGMLEFSSTVIIGGGEIESGMKDIFLKVEEALAGVTDIGGEIGQIIHAEQIDGYLEHIVSLANSKHMDQYLFGGSDTNSAPYLVERTDGKITYVTYQGSSEDRNIEVAPGMQLSAFHIGEDIFCSKNRSDSEFLLNSTGAQPGTGTSSVTGYTWLTITHDTVNSEYILSIDDGASSVTVPDDGSGSANLALTDSRTGQVLYIDTTGISSAGVELISVAGTHDIFNTLITLRDVLENEKGLSSGQLQVLRDDLFEAVEEMRNLLVQDSVSMGSKIELLDNLRSSLEDMEFNTEDEKTRLEEADIAQIAIDLTRREVLYEMSLSVAAKLLSMSLLDFLQ